MPRVCPWWIGYFLLNPLRRWRQDPVAILGPFVRDRMRVIEPGPGMGFFTLDLARLVGESGRVIAIDRQPKMLARLRRRAVRAGLAGRIELRQAASDSLGIDDLEGRVDFALAFAVIHEVPDADRFFAEIYRALRPGAVALVAEPRGHVGAGAFARTVATAERAGFGAADGPKIAASRTAVLTRQWTVDGDGGRRERPG